MKEIGSRPAASGAEAGQTMALVLIPHSPDAKADAKLKAQGVKLHWQLAPVSGQAKAKKASKTKYKRVIRKMRLDQHLARHAAALGAATTCVCKAYKRSGARQSTSASDDTG